MTAVLKTIAVNWSKNRSYSWRWHWFSANNLPFSCSSWRTCSSRERACWLSTLVVHCNRKNEMRQRWTTYVYRYRFIISYLPKPQADQYVCVARHFHFWDVTHVRQTHGSSSNKQEKKLFQINISFIFTSYNAGSWSLFFHLSNILIFVDYNTLAMTKMK